MTPHAFPHYPGAFVGRESEIGEIVARLIDPACRLLTLVGPGGIGKTRLAVEIAHHLADENTIDHFPQGMFFVPLQPLGSPDHILTAIAEAIGFEFVQGGEPQQQILNFLREKTLLLVLDNFEHLLDGVAILSDILAHAPHVKILATSRETLNLHEEWLYQIKGMRYPIEANETDIEAYSAIQLFAQHARRVQPNFALADEQEAVSRICQLVEGLPLALEITAVWLKRLPCREIVRELERGLDILEAPARNVTARHRSMRAVFEYSWTLLNDTERNVFKKLSVFRGSFRREGAEAVAGASLAVLSLLVDKSLLRVDAGGRYDLHELVRQYGEEQLDLEPQVSEAVRDRHCAYYAGFMEQREADVKGRRQLAALNEIEADFENVRAAWLWALERRNFTAVDQMLDALDLFCVARRDADAETLFLPAWEKLAPFSGEPPHRVWGRVLARPHQPRLEDYAARRIRREQALTIARQFGDPVETAICLYWLGESHKNLRDYPGAIPYLEESVGLLRPLGERFWLAKALNELGLCHAMAGQPAKAIPYTQESLDLRRQIGDGVGIGWCLHDLGAAHYQLNQLDQAERFWGEALEQFRAVKHAFGQFGMVFRLMQMSFRSGDFDSLLQLSKLWSASQDPDRFFDPAQWFLDYAGLAAGVDGNYELCWRTSEQTLKAASAIGGSRPDALFGMALAACGLHDWAMARDYLTMLLEGRMADSHAWKYPCPPIAAVLLAQDNELEKATELLGCAFASPAHLIGWAKRWSLIADLADHLETELGKEAYATAWERGQKLDIDDVIAALRTHFGANVEVQPPDPPQPLDDPLTPREMEVLHLVAAGQSNREIAHTLVLALGTVKWYVSEIYSKLGVRSRTQAIARAHELDLL